MHTYHIEALAALHITVTETETEKKKGGGGGCSGINIWEDEGIEIEK